MEGASGISTCGVHILTKTNVANAGGLAQLWCTGISMTASWHAPVFMINIDTIQLGDDTETQIYRH